MRLAKVSGQVIDLARNLVTPIGPTGVFAIAGDGSAQVFWDDSKTPGMTATVTASTGQTVTGASPVTVTGLTNGTAATFTVRRWLGISSWASDAVTPTAGDPGIVYYVDQQAGSDTANGLTPATALKTASKAITIGLTPGDAILFKRGQTWRNDTMGLLQNTVNGASGQPITIGAYGRGTAPLFDGGTVITGWTSYTTQATNPQQLVNAAMETFSSANSQTFPTGWSCYVGSGGGSQTKESTLVDTGSTGAAKLTFGGGTNILSQTTTAPINSGVAYTWASRITTDSAGASAGVSVQQQIRIGDGTQVPYQYLRSDGTWTATAVFYGTVTPTTSYATYSVTFTLPVTTQVYVGYQSVPGLYSGQAVYLDNASLLAATAQPTSPNTYRLALSRASGSYPGMLWVDGIYRTYGFDQDRLANQSWGYDGSYLYYRQDSGNPATDGHVYEVPTTNYFIYLKRGTDFVFRDLAFRLYNGWALGCNGGTGGNSVRIVYAENTVTLTGSQDLFSGTPGGNGALFMVNVETYGIMRGNTVSSCNTDLLYAIGVASFTCTDNILTLGIGDSADGIQTGDAGLTMGYQYIARNVIDQRGTPSPKGCIITGSGAAGGLIEYNTIYGGHFGIEPQTSNMEVRYNQIYQVGIDPANQVPWAAGIYSDNGGNGISNQNIHHNLMVGCKAGFNFNSGTHAGFTIAKNTVVSSTTAGVIGSVSWSSSTLSNNVFYNPTATSGEGVPVGASGLTETGNLAGTDPVFVDTATYVPTAAAAAGKGWTA